VSTTNQFIDSSFEIDSRTDFSVTRNVLRAVGDLRRGEAVVLSGSDQVSLYVMAAEGECGTGLDQLAGIDAVPKVLISGPRAQSLGLTDQAGRPVTLRPTSEQLTVDWLNRLADPTLVHSAESRSSINGRRPSIAENHDRVFDLAGAMIVIEGGASVDSASRVTEDMELLTVAALKLLKLARLLPTAVIATVTGAVPEGMGQVSADEVAHVAEIGPTQLAVVARSPVPLDGAEQTEMISFRPADGGKEHLAIVIGDVDTSGPVLCRLHSECFTGDLLGSLKCDCGDQLRGAVQQIAAEGSGILLYLAQEGRGIGLVNKLRAYALQAEGVDTLDANLQLGFDADERVFQPAVEMLRSLGVDAIRLMTNNPEKVAAFSEHGIAVLERVPLSFAANGHNEGYLRTKSERFGHDL